MDYVTRKAVALRNARDRAKDPDFKLLWELKLRELLRKNERGEIPSDRVQ